MDDIKENTVVLDGRKITESELYKEKEKKNIRIVETSEPNTYKTLKRLHD